MAIRHKKEYSLSAELRHKGSMYILNNVFEKIVAGILSKPSLPVCSENDCLYELNVKSNHVRVMNIESYMINDIEELSIKHYDEYYDRVYA